VKHKVLDVFYSPLKIGGVKHSSRFARNVVIQYDAKNSPHAEIGAIKFD